MTEKKPENKTPEKKTGYNPIMTKDDMFNVVENTTPIKKNKWKKPEERVPIVIDIDYKSKNPIKKIKEEIIPKKDEPATENKVVKKPQVKIKLLEDDDIIDITKKPKPVVKVEPQKVVEQKGEVKREEKVEPIITKGVEVEKSPLSNIKFNAKKELGLSKKELEAKEKKKKEEERIRETRNELGRNYAETVGKKIIVENQAEKDKVNEIRKILKTIEYQDKYEDEKRKKNFPAPNFLVEEGKKESWAKRFGKWWNRNF